MQISFTDRAIRTKAIKPGTYRFGPGHFGLFIEVPRLKSGNIIQRWYQKVYIKDIVTHGKARPKEFPLGKYPKVGVTAAYRIGEANAKLADQGFDPRAPSSLPDFHTLAMKLVTQYCTLQEGDDKPRWSASTRYDRMNTLQNHVLPFIGDKPIDEIETTDLTYLIELHRKTPTPANQAVSFIEDLFDHYKTKKYSSKIKVNPIDQSFRKQMKRGRKTKHRPALSHMDLPAAIDAVDEHTEHDIAVRAMLKTIMITGLRLHSARDAEWSEIQWKEIQTEEDWIDKGWEPVDWDNLDGSTKAILWRIPVNHMKMSDAFDLPVPSQLLEIFKELRAISGKRKRNSALIFPGPKAAKISKSTIRKLHRKLPFESDTPGKKPTVHGYRSTCRTWGEVIKAPEKVTEAALAHNTGSALKLTYMRSEPMEPRVRYMQFYADYAFRLLPLGKKWVEPEVQAQIDAEKERADNAERRAVTAEQELTLVRSELSQVKNQLITMTETLQALQALLEQKPAA